MRTRNPVRLLIALIHRRWAAVYMMDAQEWLFYGDPEWYSYNVRLARRHLRTARKWEGV